MTPRDPFCDERLPAAADRPALLPLPTLGADGPVLNCATWVLDGCATDTAPCLVTDHEIWTYADLVRRSDELARVLVEQLGVLPGNRVLLRGFNDPMTVACWFAVLKAGAVAVTTVPLLRATELAAIATAAQPLIALCDERLTAAAAAAGLTVVGYEALGALARRGPFSPVPTAPEDVALLAFTSGTTGHPKATAHTHRDVLAIVDTFCRAVLRPVSSDVFTGSPPIGFTYGLGGLVIFPLSAGASVVLLERGAPQQLVDAIERHRATVLFTAPTAYRAMLELLPGRDVTSLRRCVSAGEPLPAATWHAFHDATGVRLIDGLGTTELLHIVISAADELIRPGATGLPVDGYEARVVDAHGEPVPDGTVGRLAVRGPTGCRYLADDRQREYVQRGWNITGDEYVRDADGYFWFRSRSDDMIISGGYNIAPLEVEHALLLHPDVAEAAVVAQPDPARGHIVAAHVVLRREVSAAELQEFVRQRIAPYKYPRVIHFADALPRTTTGKLTRHRLRDSSACG